jgi:hypothetical protein
MSLKKPTISQEAIGKQLSVVFQAIRFIEGVETADEVIAGLRPRLLRKGAVRNGLKAGNAPNDSLIDHRQTLR